MKKTSLAVLLPVAAGLALAGSGFGAWVFADANAQKSLGANFDVTPALNLGETMQAEVDSNGKFIFDQSGVPGTIDINVTVSTEWIAGTTATADENVDYTFADLLATENQSVDYTYDVTVEILEKATGATLSDYITVTASDSTVSDTVLVKAADENVELTGFSVTASWKSGAQAGIDDKTKYETFLAAAKNSKIVITLDNFTAVAATNA